MRITKKIVLISGVVVVAVVATVPLVNRKNNPPIPTTSALTAYAPQPNRRFITIGPGDVQFTSAQFDTLATNYGLVILNKSFGTIGQNYEAARELKKRNPSIKVEVYMNTKIWYTRQARGWDEAGYTAFNDAWLLRDKNGNLIPHINNKKESNNQFMIDVSNADYRNWALAVLQRWVANAPYDGIHFDAGNDYADGYNSRDWTKILTNAKFQALNAGIKDLHTRAEQTFSSKIVTFNGLAPSDYKGESRSKEKLAYMDGATDEAFCLGGNDKPSEYLNDDIGIMQTYKNKFILLHTNHSETMAAAQVSTVGRYCLGNFLMGWQPGSSYYKLATDGYGTEALGNELPELNLNLGNPTAEYKRAGSVLSRTFANGLVYVNQGTAAQNIVLPANTTLFENGASKATYNSGATYVLGAQTAAYFMINSASTSAGSTENPASSGSTTGNTAAEQASSEAGEQANTAANDPALPEVKSIGDLPGAIVEIVTSPAKAKKFLTRTTLGKIVGVTLLAGLAGGAFLLNKKYRPLQKFNKRPAHANLPVRPSHPPATVVEPQIIRPTKGL